MCGLIGYISPYTNGFSNNEIDAVEQALILNSLRGDDSTGAVAIDNKNVWQWRKAIGNPKRFLESHTQWGDLRRTLFARGKVVFGHGRAATRGDVNAENAHPFDITRDDKSHLLLVHNGTLHAHQSLPGFSEHDVDSEWLAKTIATIGAEEALSQVNGAIATIWWDEKDNTINFYRNYERPLWTAILKSGGLIYNSEPEIIKYLAHRFKLELKEGPYELSPYVWCKMNPMEKMHAWHNKNITRKVVAAAVGVQYPGNFPHQGGRRRGKQHVQHGKKGTSPSLIPMPTGNTSINDVNPYEDGSDEWMLVEGHANFVEWDHETDVKKIHYMGGSWEEEKSVPPNKSILKMYYRPQKREIIEVHAHPTVPDKYDMVVRSVDEEVEELESATKPHKGNGETACLVLPFVPDAPKKVNEEAKRLGYLYDEIHDEELAVTFRKGKDARWHTRSARGALIRHTATSETDYPTFFTSYENDVDGKWRMGQELNLEYYQCEVVTPIGQVHTKPYLKVFCSTISTKMDECIDFVFQTDKWNKEDLKRIGFFKGSVAWMRVLNKDERDKDSKAGIVQIYVGNVQPLENAAQVH
jgi:predicted glutamine amidotransferase